MNLLKFVKSFKPGLIGIKELLTENNFRIGVFVTILILISGFLFNISRADWLIVILTIGFVLAIEAVNSNFEQVLDFQCPTENGIKGKIKDLSAGAAVLAVIFSIIIGVIIFYPYVANLF